MRREELSGVRLLRFESAGEFASVLDPQLSIPIAGTDSESLRVMHMGESARGRAWFGGTVDDARAHLKTGDPAGAARALALAARLETAILDVAPRDTRRRPRWSEDQGDEIDMDRLRSGAPAWRDMHRCARADGRGVQILAPVGGNCPRDPEELVWCAALATALCDVIERAGIPCAVMGVQCADHHGSKGYTSCTTEAKRFGEALQHDVVAGILSGCAFRHFGIGAVYAAHPSPNEAAGRSTDPKKVDGLVQHLTDGARAMVLPFVYSEQEAIAAAQSCLTEAALDASAA